MCGADLKYGDYYMLFNGSLEVLVCQVDLLFQYDFSGRRVCSLADHGSLSEFLESIYKIISEFKIKFLLVSVDPFILTPLHELLLKNIQIPIGAIICDTHHGTKPLSRVLEFCINVNVKSILLQFNQRHRMFFESLGIPVSCSFFSPDLYSFISNARLPSTKSDDKHVNSISTVTNSYRKGVFVGSVTSVHMYRNYLLGRASAIGIQLDVLKAPDPLSMIELTSVYPWALNLPLNGDFNRRFVESYLASTCVISEIIPSSQLFFPYSLFKDTTLFFKEPSEIPGLINNNYEQLEFFGRLNYKRCIDLYESGFEITLLRDFVKPLVVSSSGMAKARKIIPNQFDSLLYQASVYEELLAASLVAYELSTEQKNELLSKGRQFIGDLYNIQDEFYRLCE